MKLLFNKLDIDEDDRCGKKSVNLDWTISCKGYPLEFPDGNPVIFSTLPGDGSTTPLIDPVTSLENPHFA